MERFVSESPFKTRPLEVNVTDNDGNVIRTYITPAGFQLERYVASIHPNASLELDHTVGFAVKVYDQDNNKIETHTGVYKN